MWPAVGTSLTRWGRRAWHRSVRHLASRRLLGIPDAVARLARSYLRSYDPSPDPYDLRTNGEQLVIERVLRPGSTAFDVGANVGDWSALALAAGATVHAFEISPETAGALSSRFTGEPQVTVHGVGLSDAPGELEIRHYPDAPVLSTTITDYPHPYRFEDLTVPVTAGADFADAHDIDRIDLLKIDVEGAEPAVLTGFGPMLERGQIDVIQFEYGLVAVIEKFLVRDFYALLEPLGFTLGPLGPDGVDFTPYRIELELFEHVNWVAVRADRGDLVDRLRRRNGQSA